MIGMKRLVAGYLLCILNIIESGMKGKKNKLCFTQLTKACRCDISEAAMDCFIARFPDAPLRSVPV